MKHCLSCLIYYVKHSCLYNKLHSYSFNYFSVSDWLIYHNQSLLTKFGENFVTLKQLRQNDIQSAAHYRLSIELLTRVFLLTKKTWGQGCVIFGEQKDKERNGETP